MTEKDPLRKAATLVDASWYIDKNAYDLESLRFRPNATEFVEILRDLRRALVEGLTSPSRDLRDRRFLLVLLREWKDALTIIAAEDDLVEASSGAWCQQAYERRRDVAREALKALTALDEVRS